MMSLFYNTHTPPANQRPVFGSREQCTANQRPVFRLHGDHVTVLKHSYSLYLQDDQGHLLLCCCLKSS